MDRDTFTGLLMLAAVAAGGALIGNALIAAALAIAVGVAIIELARFLQRFTGKS